MNPVKTLLTVFFLLFSLISKAQNCDFSLGSKTLYHAPTVRPTPAPEGYHLVFMNHAGRHGARHLTKTLSGSHALLLLQKADSLKLLSIAGSDLLASLNKLNAVEKEYVKSISETGREEQKGIAARLFEQDSNFFRNGLGYTVEITKEKRTEQTADAFLDKMEKLSGSRQRPKYIVNDTALRFYDISPAYLEFEKTGVWKQPFEHYSHKTFSDKSALRFAQQFFNPLFTEIKSKDASRKFTGDIFGFLSIIPSIQNEIDASGLALNSDSIERFFSCKNLHALSAMDNLEGNLLKGPGMDNNGIQVTIARPLLADFITSTESFQKNGRAACYRFCHAETIGPIAALMQLQGAYDPKINRRKKHIGNWQSENIIPLSANIQWLVYSNGKDQLLKILLNEKPVRIEGLGTKNFPYYPLNEVLNFYKQKLKPVH